MIWEMIRRSGLRSMKIKRHRPNTALEATPHSHCGFASELFDDFELRVRGASAFVR